MDETPPIPGELFRQWIKGIYQDNLLIQNKMYVGNKHVSLEHTHPPHEYILSNNKFQKVAILKNEINEIIN